MVKARWGSFILICSLALHACNEAVRVRGMSVSYAVNESTKGEESRSHFEERAPGDMNSISEILQTALSNIQSGLNGQLVKNEIEFVNLIKDALHDWVMGTKISLFDDWRVGTKNSASKAEIEEMYQQSVQLFNAFKAQFSEFDRARIIATSLNVRAGRLVIDQHIKDMWELLMEEWKAKSQEQVYNMLRLDATHSDFLTSSMFQLFVKFLDKYHNKNYNILRDKLMEAYVDNRQMLLDRLKNVKGIGKTLLGMIPRKYWDSPTFYPAILQLGRFELVHLSVKELVRSPSLEAWCFLAESNGEKPYRILVDKLLVERDNLEFTKELEAALKEEPSGNLYGKLKQLENALFQHWMDVVKFTPIEFEKFLLLDTVKEDAFFRTPLSWIYLSYINYRGFNVKNTILQKLETKYGGVRQVIDVAKEIDPRIASMVITMYYRHWKNLKNALMDLNLMDLNLTLGVLNGRWVAHWIEFVFESKKTQDPINYVISFAKRKYSEQGAAVLLISAIEKAPTIIVKELVLSVFLEYMKQTPAKNVLAGLGLDQAGDNLFSTRNIIYWIIGTKPWNEARLKFDPFRDFYTEDKLLKLSSSASTAANSVAAVKSFADEMIQYLEALSVEPPNKRLRTSAHTP
ncbi:hypothetical protein CCR75_000168 [Bremia lactucae]|uniref:RxLR effector protein n=1 Tax=Bremia lactucae TaxID=4779 RepID=A0A976FNN7_BRELC|nr:hypothetical protein CCR75_000168 [Bremia lactucae]